MDTEVTTQVALERGQWVVYLLVTSAEGVERRPVGAHRSERTARVMADTVARTAARRRAPRGEADD